MISYKDTIDNITENMLIGFFEGWPTPPSPFNMIKSTAMSIRNYQCQAGIDSEDK